jgi:acyl-CoA reductase-like NAD-dependent aldehyde dehydrogenase
MPDGKELGKHITEALGGRADGPPGDEERVERERVRNLIQAVASCYNTLVTSETDPDRKADLAAKLAVYDDQFRRRATLSAEERREVLRTYPETLRRLRAEIGE